MAGNSASEPLGLQPCALDGLAASGELSDQFISTAYTLGGGLLLSAILER